MNYKIALAQIHIEPGQVDLNLKTALAAIEEAAQLGSAFVLLPELWSSGYDLERAALHAQATSAIWSELDRLAAAHAIAIGGSLLEARGDSVYNTFRWHSPDGAEPASYQKTHLFRLMAEDQWLTGGDHLQTVQTQWGPTGLAVCYDLRFPEMFRRYAVGGVTAAAISAEWPAKRVFHWSTLLRARAIENQMFIFAANAVGLSGGETFGGHSAVITPWGDTLTEGSDRAEDLLYAEIQPSMVEQARTFLPILTDRHPSLDRLG